EALKHADPACLDKTVLKSFDRLYCLCPGGVCDSDKHHVSGQFYPRQFAERKARAFIGYSERMYFVVDHFLNGIADDQPGVGKISFKFDTANALEVVGENDVDVVPATFSDAGSTMLSWVDILSIRKGLTAQQKSDALALIKFFNSKEFTTK